MTVSMTAEEAGGQTMVNFEVRVKRITGGSFISRVFAIDEKNDRFLLYDPGEPATAGQYAIESRFYWVDIAKCKLVFVSEKSPALIVRANRRRRNAMGMYVVVRPGKSPQDIVGFFGWSGPNKPFTSLLPRIFYSRTLAQITADKLGESGEVWVVWNVANIVQEMSDTYSACAERASYVSCGECSVPHNKWTGCPKLGGKIPPDDYSCGQGKRE